MQVGTSLAAICMWLWVCNAEAEGRNTSYIYPPWGHTWGVVRATPFKLRLFAGNKTRFNDPQGLACVRLHSWEDTTRTSDDDEVTVYGVNSGDNCIIYNRSMFSLGIYGLEGNHVRFNRPWGIAASSDGVVVIADRGNSRVVKLVNSGSELRFDREIGGPGDDDGMFIDPRGIALDMDGRIYVTDAALGRVSVFNRRGEFERAWAGFIEPDGIAVTGPVDPWRYTAGSPFAVVIDSAHSRVRKLTLDGDLTAETSADRWLMNDGRALANPPNLAYAVIDYYDQIIITDNNNGCLHKLDAGLNYIAKFGEPGSGDYQFDQPRGIALHRKLGQLFVAERASAQYLWVGVDVSGLRAVVKQDSIWRDLQVSFRVTEPALCEMEVQDRFGRFIARLAAGRVFATGENRLGWGMTIPATLPGDAKIPDLPPGFFPGKPLPPGVYKLLARFTATYSSRDHFQREVVTQFVVD